MKGILEIGSRVEVLTELGKKRGIVVDISTKSFLRCEYGNFEDLPEVGEFDEDLVQVKLNGRKNTIQFTESNIIKIF